MYEQFFGLSERPFDLTPNPRYLVLTPVHREAISNLEYGMASRKGITLLLGEAGAGKTLVIQTAVERQPSTTHCVHLHNPALTRHEFVEMLAARFGLSDQARHSKAALLLELEALLRRRHESNETTVLVVDEAQTLPPDLLEEVRMLANIETRTEKLLSVIIAGQPELARRMNEEAFRQLKQRVALRCELRPLTLQEGVAYIATRIRCAGGLAAQAFTREAVTMIHERAQGIPRTINVIADNAMVTAFGMGQRPVNSETVREVCRDFDIRGGAPRQEVAAPPAGVAAPRGGAETDRLLSLEGTASSAQAVGVPTDLDLRDSAPQTDVAAAAPKRRRFSFF